MNTNKTTKRIAYIAYCKCCGRDKIKIFEGDDRNTIDCPACGYIIDKKEWIKSDSI